MPKIIEDTEHRIVIEDRPWMLGLFLSAMVLFGGMVAFQSLFTGNWVVTLAGLAFGLGALIALNRAVRHVRLTLLPDRSARLNIRTVAGVTRRTFPVQTLRAGLETDHDDGPKYRVMLLVTRGWGAERVPLTRYHSSSEGHAQVVRRIRAWAETPPVIDRTGETP